MDLDCLYDRLQEVTELNENLLVTSLCLHTAFEHCASVHAFSVQMIWRKEGTPRSALLFFLLVLTCIRYIQ